MLNLIADHLKIQLHGAAGQGQQLWRGQWHGLPGQRHLEWNDRRADKSRGGLGGGLADHHLRARESD
uniref:Uncharacterized protein n=1 Tax=Macrostomum lignano TaxID=282301 RepID=A0A1I8F389_9PLAT